MENTYQYPPDLLQLLINTIPLLCPAKRDVITFFRGAGVAQSLTQDLEAQLAADRKSINKFEIVRTTLERLNERGEFALRERREILKRVVEFEDFSTCWPDDQLKAKGLVSEVRRVIGVKDSFTRMDIEREVERKQRLEEQMQRVQERQQYQANLAQIRSDLLALFSETNEQRRGKALEGVLNRFFKAAGLLVTEAFTLKGLDGEGVVEQLDGVIEIDGLLYLVEMKWWGAPLGVPAVSQHLVRVFFRGQARGIFISASGYTDPAITTCREALQKAVVVLCKLEEIILLLEQEGDIKEFFKAKINASVAHKNPLYEPLLPR